MNSPSLAKAEEVAPEKVLLATREWHPAGKGERSLDPAATFTTFGTPACRESSKHRVSKCRLASLAADKARISNCQRLAALAGHKGRKRGNFPRQAATLTTNSTAPGRGFAWGRDCQSPVFCLAQCRVPPSEAKYSKSWLGPGELWGFRYGGSRPETPIRLFAAREAGSDRIC